MLVQNLLDQIKANPCSPILLGPTVIRPVKGLENLFQCSWTQGILRLIFHQELLVFQENSDLASIMGIADGIVHNILDGLE